MRAPHDRAVMNMVLDSPRVSCGAGHAVILVALRPDCTCSLVGRIGVRAPGPVTRCRAQPR